MRMKRMLLTLVVLLGMLSYSRSTTALNGQFGLEFAIDAPWRIEPIPQPDGALSYGPIPITVVFFDANFEKHRGSPAQVAGALGSDTVAEVGTAINYASGGILNAGTGVALNGTKWERISVGNLKGIWVWEATQPGDPEWLPVGLHTLREIERKGPKSVFDRPEPPHQMCRPSIGEDCTSLYNIGNAHEWHALFWYTPKQPIKPGQNIHLGVQVQTKKDGDCSPNIFECDTNILKWQNFLVVHAGETPLPRFSKDWLYGDLHYHSQMTDNEGESGYAYRNVVRALGAMGLDFVFATDHASNSVQIDGGGEARDLTSLRYIAAKQIMNGPGGANDEIARDAQIGAIANFTSRRLLPQVFMGEEVDVMPEMAQAEFEGDKINYGDGLTYPWSNVSGCLRLTKEQIGEFFSVYNKPVDQFCRERFSYPPIKAGRFFTQDNQGIPVIDTQPEPSRQHMVYFPERGNYLRPTQPPLPPPDSNDFVPSSTRTYGGASKTIDQVVQEIQAKGVTFLAHPLSSAKPGSAIGPDIVPYSAVALERAWGSQAVLGLQFWNENDRFKSPKIGAVRKHWMDVRMSGDTHFFSYTLPWFTTGFKLPFEGTGSIPSVDHRLFPWTWMRSVDGDGVELHRVVASELYQGAHTWDVYLRKGLDPTQTSALSWLQAGEPRKWFMAAGSDSHGDWNFRRYGQPCLARWCGAPAGDTAIGNPRNLVLAGEPIGIPAPGLSDVRRHTSGQVINALKHGNFSPTDGPALRIAIDRNRNGSLDDDDFNMGTTFNLFPGEQVPLLIEWMSTPEFARIKKIDVYLGTKDRTYAPDGHGPPHTVCSGQRLISNTEFLKVGGKVEETKSGKEVRVTCEESAGAYFRQGMGVLRIDLTSPDLDSSIGYSGMARVYLTPNEPFYLSEHSGKLFYLRAYAQTYGRAELLFDGPKIAGADPAEAANWIHTCTDAQGNPQSPLTPGKCGDRHAYSNPIWGRYNQTCGPSGQSIDGNGNGMPDTCEQSGGWPDMCVVYGRGTRSCSFVEPLPCRVGSASCGTTEATGHLLLLN